MSISWSFQVAKRARGRISLPGPVCCLAALETPLRGAAGAAEAEEAPEAPPATGAALSAEAREPATSGLLGEPNTTIGEPLQARAALPVVLSHCFGPPLVGPRLCGGFRTSIVPQVGRLNEV